MTDKFNPNDYEFRILAIDAPWYNGIEILIEGLKIDGTRRQVYDFPLGDAPQVMEPGQRRLPTLTLSWTAAETLMNQLWHCGIRPEKVGSAGQLSATEKHLEDMRKISFQYLDHMKVIEQAALEEDR